jgi:hypothetical protein
VELMNFQTNKFCTNRICLLALATAYKDPSKQQATHLNSVNQSVCCQRQQMLCTWAQKMHYLSQVCQTKQAPLIAFTRLFSAVKRLHQTHLVQLGSVQASDYIYIQKGCNFSKLKMVFMDLVRSFASSLPTVTPRSTCQWRHSACLAWTGRLPACRKLWANRDRHTVLASRPGGQRQVGLA